MIESLLEFAETSRDEVDYYMFHQPTVSCCANFVENSG